MSFPSVRLPSTSSSLRDATPEALPKLANELSVTSLLSPYNVKSVLRMVKTFFVQSGAMYCSVPRSIRQAAQCPVR
ncbi:hypothetical protein SERLA73DRAFT_169311 [Serpula lacrymans var. lacrymans S7.3]|uniref:Uncharacterized protein n=2 Tax=Serpula lacrymans var. lacrymans TaxID=341189 RepID=F8PZJ3_SERL3|nr:uncharacterized protein SERLADRAFT_470328 [Serpula lacrymans var. lacrymans S7.9]EGN98315.1 hypothetical protein SERLA73DRAFT_169311 [Serpula lacrymans var. lacrymans S7.3]EGO23881.1 hypothetical protein SERLADRAFT_470328 [Serpula lacrymans var. lacrymans S7.9]